MEDELDSLFSRIDSLLTAGDFAAVDREVAAVDVEAAALALLLGWLSITSAAKYKLTERAALVAKVIARVNRDEPTEMAAALLRGLV